jgi:hypothetical protein
MIARSVRQSEASNAPFITSPLLPASVPRPTAASGRTPPVLSLPLLASLMPAARRRR